MNFKTIADGIAARMASVTATNGSASETATATASLPNQIGTLALLVYPPTGTLSILMGPRLHDQYDFPVKLLRDPLNVPDRSDWLYAWATALRTTVQSSFTLGIAGVYQTEFADLRVELDGEKYARVDGSFVDFDVVELTARVWLDEITTVGI